MDPVMVKTEPVEVKSEEDADAPTSRQRALLFREVPVEFINVKQEITVAEIGYPQASGSSVFLKNKHIEETTTTERPQNPAAEKICIPNVSAKPAPEPCKLKKNTSRSFACDVCDRKFNRKCKLVTHLEKHSDDAEEETNLSTASDDANTLNSESEGKCYECSICKKKFLRRGHLVAHSRTHTGEKPYECSVCHKRFIVSGNLTTHMKIHSAEKPFECSICHRRLRFSGSLTSHMKTHTGEKPYQCPECHKLFNCSSNLTKHIKIHTGEKPYECSICSKRFIESGHLTRHMKVHSADYAIDCTICNKKFTRSGHLTRHMRTHTEESSHECPICYKRFIIRANLTKHMLVHGEGKPTNEVPQTVA